MLIRRLRFDGGSHTRFNISGSEFTAKSWVGGVSTYLDQSANEQQTNQQLAHLHLNHSPLVTLGDTNLAPTTDVFARWVPSTNLGIANGTDFCVAITARFTAALTDPLAAGIAINLGVEGANDYAQNW